MKNKNGRVYSSGLWSQVIKKQMGENCYSLIGHPEGDGNPANSWAVTRNLRFSEDKKLILADFYLFGPLGRQALAGLEAGGEIGLSTSGFGGFCEDDFTIEESTYELERVADFVLEPSAGVFGTLEDIKESTNKVRKKLFAENGKLKKMYNELYEEHQMFKRAICRGEEVKND